MPPHFYIMYYNERPKIVKSIEITIPRKEAILAIKKEFALEMSQSKEFYEALMDGSLLGEDYDSQHGFFLHLKNRLDWCNVETEEAPLTKKEKEEEELRLEAEAWEKTLTDKERKYMKILNPIVVAVAG